MERVRCFVQEGVSKAYGLLQVIKEKLLPEVEADVENGPTDPSRPLLAEYPLDDTPALNSIDVLRTFPSSNSHQIEREGTPQPRYTKGPARFIVTNDGSEDCMALLVTKSLITKLCDLFEDNLQLENKSGPLQHAKIDAHEAQISANEAKESLDEVKESAERAENLERVQKLQRLFQQ